MVVHVAIVGFNRLTGDLVTNGKSYAHRCGRILTVSDEVHDRGSMDISEVTPSGPPPRQCSMSYTLLHTHTPSSARAEAKAWNSNSMR